MKRMTFRDIGGHTIISQFPRSATVFDACRYLSSQIGISENQIFIISPRRKQNFYQNKDKMIHVFNENPEYIVFSVCSKSDHNQRSSVSNRFWSNFNSIGKRANTQSSPLKFPSFNLLNTIKKEKSKQIYMRTIKDSIYKDYQRIFRIYPGNFQEMVNEIAQLGFSIDDIKEALRESQFDVQLAINILISRNNDDDDTNVNPYQRNGFIGFPLGGFGHRFPRQSSFSFNSNNNSRPNNNGFFSNPFSSNFINIAHTNKKYSNNQEEIYIDNGQMPNKSFSQNHNSNFRKKTENPYYQKNSNNNSNNKSYFQTQNPYNTNFDKNNSQFKGSRNNSNKQFNSNKYQYDNHDRYKNDFSFDKHSNEFNNDHMSYSDDASYDDIVDEINDQHDNIFPPPPPSCFKSFQIKNPYSHNQQKQSPNIFNEPNQEKNSSNQKIQIQFPTSNQQINKIQFSFPKKQDQQFTPAQIENPYTQFSFPQTRNQIETPSSSLRFSFPSQDTKQQDFQRPPPPPQFTSFSNDNFQSSFIQPNNQNQKKFLQFPPPPNNPSNFISWQTNHQAFNFSPEKNKNEAEEESIQQPDKPTSQRTPHKSCKSYTPKIIPLD